MPPGLSEEASAEGAAGWVQGGMPWTVAWCGSGRIALVLSVVKGITMGPGLWGVIQRMLVSVREGPWFLSALCSCGVRGSLTQHSSSLSRFLGVPQL